MKELNNGSLVFFTLVSIRVLKSRIQLSAQAALQLAAQAADVVRPLAVSGR